MHSKNWRGGITIPPLAGWITHSMQYGGDIGGTIVALSLHGSRHTAAPDLAAAPPFHRLNMQRRCTSSCSVFWRQLSVLSASAAVAEESQFHGAHHYALGRPGEVGG